MNKPWKICATFRTLERKELGSYSQRSCAEQDASRYRRFLAGMASVNVVWDVAAELASEINGKA